MKAIYLVQNKNSLKAVYAPALREELESHYGGMLMLSKEELEANLDALKDTEYIFSTWSMPAFSEEEIHSLEELIARAGLNGIAGVRLISGYEARTMEPQLSEEVVAALYVVSVNLAPLGTHAAKV